MDFFVRTLGIVFWWSLSLCAMGILFKLNNLPGANTLLNVGLPLVSIGFFFRAFAKKE